MCEVFTLLLMSLHKDTPSLRGIMISLITRSNSKSSISFSASTPSPACITWNSSDKASAMSTLKSVLSSTIRISGHSEAQSPIPAPSCLPEFRLPQARMRGIRTYHLTSVGQNPTRRTHCYPWEDNHHYPSPFSRSL